jgi:hypothetical protein
MRAVVSRFASRTRFDLENGMVLVLGWLVALAVTWT